MMATANQKCHEYNIGNKNVIHTIAAKSPQQQSPSFPAKLKINDRVSSVHVDIATGNCKHKHVHRQNISNCLAACNCEAAHRVCAP